MQPTCLGKVSQNRLLSTMCILVFIISKDEETNASLKVLVLTGKVLIFFTVVLMVLCFEFVTKTVLSIH